MESKKVLPSVLSGLLRIPASKSIAHRAVICASLAAGTSRLRGIDLSQDIEATIEAMRQLGARIHWEGNELVVQGIMCAEASADLFCGESGSTLRFLIPVAAALGISARFAGAGRLGERPLSVYEDTLPQHGILWRREESWLPLSIEGQLQPGRFLIRGDVSSQFITGLLLALPMLAEDSEIILTTPLESEPYVTLTLSAMDAFGVHAERTEQGYRIPGGQRYQPVEYEVEADYSQAAFMLAAGALAASPAGMRLKGLRKDSLQGDRVILQILSRMGVPLEWQGETLWVHRAESLRNIEVDASQCPDLIPVVAAIGCCAEGQMVIRNAARLRLKESDRLRAIHQEYEKIGARITESEDGLLVEGSPASYIGGTAESENDHRMAMSLAVLAQHTREGIQVLGSESVSKSWPTFWTDLAQMGGNYE